MIETRIEAASYLEKLAHAIVKGYSPQNKTPEQILTNLLAFQQLTPLITLGTVEITGSYSFDWENTTTVLACMNDAYEVWGGYFDVADNNVLNWLTSIGEDKGQQIRYRKNLIGITKDEDWAGLATVLYPEGNGIRLSDKQVVWETAAKSSDANYGYLSITQGDYICMDFSTLSVWRKGSRTNYDPDIADNVTPTTGWQSPSSAIDEDPNTYAYHSYSTGYNTTGQLGVRWLVHRYISGCRITLDRVGGGTIYGIRVYYTNDTFKTKTLIYDNDNYNITWPPTDVDIDFGQPYMMDGIAIQIKTVCPSDPDTVRIYDVYPWTEYYDESSSWSQGYERIIKIPIASYHPDDTYYLTYNLADYLKNFAAVLELQDEEGNGGIIPTSMTFNRADSVDTLIAWAQAAMSTLYPVPTSYSVRAINLPEVDANFSFDELEVGSVVTAIDEELGADIKSEVKSKDYPDLSDETQFVAEIANKTQDLTAAFRNIYRKI